MADNNTDSNYLDLAACAALLRVRKRDLERAIRDGTFADPSGTDNGDAYWTKAAVLTWWAAQGPDQAATVPVDLWPTPERPAQFLGATRRPTHSGQPDDVLLRWATPSGVVGMLWRPDQTAYRPRYEALFAEFDASVLIEIGGDFGLYGPTLWARNQPTPSDDGRYEVAWHELAQVLAQPVPYWPYALRDPDLIAAWQPDTTTVTAPAIPDLDTASLLRMAAMFGPRHATHRTLLALVQEVQRRATRSADDDLRQVDTNAQRISQYRHRWPRSPEAPIQIAARPLQPAAPLPDLDDLDPTVGRIGWGELLGRTDTLSWRCVRQCLLWDGGKLFPFSNPEEVDPTTPWGSEWRARLEPAPDQPAAFAQIIPDGERVVAAFRDPLTDAPAVVEDGDRLRTCVPNRIPAHHPLAEIVLDEGLVWVRTTDGTLYPAPKDHYFGLNWGYSGSGPGSLALLIHRLLDDINAEAADAASGAAPGLDELTELAWPSGTVLDRTLLEAARDGRPYRRPDNV